MDTKEVSPAASSKPATLKTLAAYLKLDPTTISVVLNDVPGRSIPEATRERIRAAALKFNYHPSLVARSLRSRKTQTIGILVPVLSNGYHSEVIGGIGDYLIENEYFYFIAHHRHRPDLVEAYPRMLTSRGAEGLILVDTHIDHSLPVPAIAVAGSQKIPGMLNVVLDHDVAARLALKHLYDLGHRAIAFQRGPQISSDSETRWQSLTTAARELGLVIQPELTIQIDKDLTSPELGYPGICQLVDCDKPFTALVAFNDMAAVGAIRALNDAGFRVPTDVSVLGFDDIPQAAFLTPSLTTIRQPLHEMGRLSAELLLERLRSEVSPQPPAPVHPELVVRESTGPCRLTAKNPA